jgi:nucleoside 2-deoxyribosyltransferase
MNIYFSCSLTGGREDESVYQQIVAHLLGNGHSVPTAHLASSEVMSVERVVEAREVFLRDIAWIDACQALVAEVSTPSHGVGYEIAYALEHNKPVLCCYRRGVKVSKMITGNNLPGMRLAQYDDGAEAISAVDAFLNSVAGQKGLET